VVNHLRTKQAVAIFAASISAIALTACASNSASAPKTTAVPGGSTTPAAASSSSASSAPATSAAASSSASVAAPAGGTILKGEPDTNGDGKVIIGVLSPGDINDHGYYQSFVDEADTFAKSKGWTVIKRGSVPDTNALSAARALCAQHVDMVALAAGELSDAIPASTEAVCKNTAWYVPSAANIAQTPTIVLSSDDPNVDIFAAGFAAGTVMKAKGYTKAAFIGGPSADYSKAAGKAFAVGVKYVVPSATVTSTFTGDNNDSAKAKEAATAAISQGAKVIYPYLGGGADAAALVANAAGAITLTPGTDKCAATKPSYDISVLFSPGDFFAAALQSFAAGKLAMGVAKIWQMGVDPFPSVKMCSSVAAQAPAVADMIKQIGAKTIDPNALVKAAK
jgi:basic membrane protein A